MKLLKCNYDFKKKRQTTHSMNVNVSYNADTLCNTQVWKFQGFLHLNFYVKSNFWVLEDQKVPFWQF